MVLQLSQNLEILASSCFQVSVPPTSCVSPSQSADTSHLAILSSRYVLFYRMSLGCDWWLGNTGALGGLVSELCQLGLKSTQPAVHTRPMQSPLWEGKVEKKNHVVPHVFQFKKHWYTEKKFPILTAAHGFASESAVMLQ